MGEPSFYSPFDLDLADIDKILADIPESIREASAALDKENEEFVRQLLETTEFPLFTGQRRSEHFVEAFELTLDDIDKILQQSALPSSSLFPHPEMVTPQASSPPSPKLPDTLEQLASPAPPEPAALPLSPPAHVPASVEQEDAFDRECGAPTFAPAYIRRAKDEDPEKMNMDLWYLTYIPPKENAPIEVLLNDGEGWLLTRPPRDMRDYAVRTMTEDVKADIGNPNDIPKAIHQFILDLAINQLGDKVDATKGSKINTPILTTWKWTPLDLAFLWEYMLDPGTTVDDMNSALTSYRNTVVSPDKLWRVPVTIQQLKNNGGDWNKRNFSWKSPLFRLPETLGPELPNFVKHLQCYLLKQGKPLPQPRTRLENNLNTQATLENTRREQAFLNAKVHDLLPYFQNDRSFISYMEHVANDVQRTLDERVENLPGEALNQILNNISRCSNSYMLGVLSTFWDPHSPLLEEYNASMTGQPLLMLAEKMVIWALGNTNLPIHKIITYQLTDLILHYLIKYRNDNIWLGKQRLVSDLNGQLTQAARGRGWITNYSLDLDVPSEQLSYVDRRGGGKEIYTPDEAENLTYVLDYIDDKVRRAQRISETNAMRATPNAAGRGVS